MGGDGADVLGGGFEVAVGGEGEQGDVVAQLVDPLELFGGAGCYEAATDTDVAGEAERADAEVGLVARR